jgi:hypothetical protein
VLAAPLAAAFAYETGAGLDWAGWVAPPAFSLPLSFLFRRLTSVKPGSLWTGALAWGGLGGGVTWFPVPSGWAVGLVVGTAAGARTGTRWRDAGVGFTAFSRASSLAA